MEHKMIRWFNDSVVLSWLLAPWSKKKFFRFTQRLRICEHCGTLEKNIHKANYDHKKGNTVTYDHVWLCDSCFYNPEFAHPFEHTCLQKCWPKLP